MSNPNKKYLVTYSCEYDVEALDKDEALVIALEQHAHLPDGIWEVILIENN